MEVVDSDDDLCYVERGLFFSEFFPGGYKEG
jgi:hypothetical protein